MTAEGSGGFGHEALLYHGEQGFVAGTLAFLEAGLEKSEPVLVVVPPVEIDLLKGALGEDAHRVAFADMTAVGANPARIIPVWLDFVSDHPRAPCRWGVGQPVFLGRRPEELTECQSHESLLNLALARAGPFRLLCPYDTTALGPGALAAVARDHPVLRDGTAARPSPSFSPDPPRSVLGAPLAPAPAGAERVEFSLTRLRAVRELVERAGALAGLEPGALEDLVLATHEIATNSVRHGGGRGTLLVWRSAEGLVCQVSDAGWISDALVGRRRPAPGATGGRGIWLAHRLCDLVEIRSGPSGTSVRLHQRATA